MIICKIIYLIQRSKNGGAETMEYIDGLLSISAFWQIGMLFFFCRVLAISNLHCFGSYLSSFIILYSLLILLFIDMVSSSFDSLRKHFEVYNCTRSTTAHFSKVHCLDFNSDGRRLASGSFDKTGNYCVISN